MASAPRVSAARNRGLQDDHDHNDIGQKTGKYSHMEDPAAYATEDAKKGAGHRTRRARAGAAG